MRLDSSSNRIKFVSDHNSVGRVPLRSAHDMYSHCRAVIPISDGMGPVKSSFWQTRLHIPQPLISAVSHRHTVSGGGGACRLWAVVCTHSDVKAVIFPMSVGRVPARLLSSSHLHPHEPIISTGSHRRTLSSGGQSPVGSGRAHTSTAALSSAQPRWGCFLSECWFPLICIARAPLSPISNRRTL